MFELIITDRGNSKSSLGVNVNDGYESYFDEHILEAVRRQRGILRKKFKGAVHLHENM